MNVRGPESDRPWAGLDAVVEALAPGSVGIEAFLDRTRTAFAPDAEGAFSEARIALLGELSEAFLTHALLRRDPATVSVAYWMRPASVLRLKAEFERRMGADPTVRCVPVGRVLHIAPANVDTMFLYSWALAFLCGNTNVVRLSRERGTVVESMLDVLRALSDRRPLLGSENRFVTYEHDQAATTAISAWCSHRVIWGGSETVAAVRPLPLGANASERVFGSKFSYSVFSASAYLAAGVAGRQKTAAAFFNDLFWFDQMACSSPHLLFWVGDAAQTAQAVKEFESALSAEVERRKFVTSAANAVHRRAFAFELAASADVSVHMGNPGFVGVEVRDVGALDREICGGGLLRYARLDRLADLAGFAEEGDQTVTHFGFAPDELAAVAAGLGARGVDRLVPVGEALAFDTIWDGFDLLADFTRRVRVKPA